MKNEAIDTHGVEMTDENSYKNQAIDFIKDVTCNYYGISKDVYLSRSRKTEKVKVRHMAIFLCHLNLKEIKLGPSALAREFNIDHSSVCSTVKKINGYIQWDKELKKEVQDLQNLLAHKGKLMAGRFNLGKEYYYINFNNIVTLRLPNGGAIAFSGVSDEIIDDIRVNIFNATERQEKHENTGIYVLKNISSEAQEEKK